MTFYIVMEERFIPHHSVGSGVVVYRDWADVEEAQKTWGVGGHTDPDSEWDRGISYLVYRTTFGKTTHELVSVTTYYFTYPPRYEDVLRREHREKE